MSPFQRVLVWVSSILTGATGLAYAWMKYLLEPADPWAVINHPLEPWLLKAHILVAPILVFAVGLIAVEHVWKHLRSGVRAGRRSGLTALWVLGPMVFSGYLIQAVTHAGWLRALVWVHLVTGVLYLVGLLLHHRFFRGNGRPPEGRRSRSPGRGASGPARPARPADGSPAGAPGTPPGDVRRRRSLPTRGRTPGSGRPRERVASRPDGTHAETVGRGR